MRAFMSFEGMLNRDLFGGVGKLTTIWFDELILQTPFEGQIDEVLENREDQGDLESSITIELKKVWRPIQSAHPEWKSLPMMSVETLNPWDEPANAELCEAVMKAIWDEIGSPGKENLSDAYWAKVGAALIHALGSWGALNALSPCGFLPYDLERTALSKWTSNGEPEDEAFNVFQTVVSHRLPDIAALSWERVFELRHHKFLGAFRTKLAEVVKHLEDGDRRSVTEILQEIERHDLVEIAKMTRPSPTNVIIKWVASNIPLPLPVNPLSIGLSIREVVSAFRSRKRFGWLYFLLDLDEEKEG